MNRNFLPAFPLNKKDLREGTLLSKDFTFVHSEIRMTSCIHHLKHVNCFIGANNSGKSRAIRALFSAIEKAEKNQNQLNVPNINKSRYNILQSIIKKKDILREKTNSEWNYKFEELFSNSFYYFENFPVIYTYWNELQNIEMELNSWYDGLEMISARLTNSLADSAIKISSIKRDIINEETNMNNSKKREDEYNAKKERKEEIEMQLKEYMQFKESEKKLKKIKELSQILQRIDVEQAAITDIALQIKVATNGYRIEQLNKQLEQKKAILEQKQSEIKTINTYNEDEINREIERIKLLELPNENNLNNELRNLERDNIPQQLKQIQENKINIEKRIQNNQQKLTKEEEKHRNLFIKEIKEEINNLINEGLKVLNDIKAAIPKLYIPILRGTRPLDDTKKDFYAERTFKDYKIDRINTFTGLSIYKELQEHLLGSYPKRQLIREFEAFLSTSFFDCQEITLIPSIGTDVVHIRIGENEHPIYNLGDGIQALIMLTFPLFLRKNEEWAIFIEEPEAHLHPKWQRFFLDTIKQYFSNHQFFFTTHSNVFLSDKRANVYQVSQTEDKKTSIKHIDKEKLNLLEELGYMPNDILQSNYIIWVEGVSDIFYIQYFLNKIAPDLKEYEHFIIMSYGGSNLVGLHKYDFLEDLLYSINPNFSVIMDSDKKKKNGEVVQSSDKKKLVDKSRGKFGDKLWVTTKREIENYIPIELFKKIIKEMSQLKDDDVITFVEDDPDFGDRMKYKTARSIKLHAGNKIELEKEDVKKFFDVENGLRELLKNENIERYKEFVRLIEAALLEARHTNVDKNKIAQKAVSLWEKSEFDLHEEIKTEISKIAERIRNCSQISAQIEANANQTEVE